MMITDIETVQHCHAYLCQSSALADCDAGKHGNVCQHHEVPTCNLQIPSSAAGLDIP